jgi:hypothetical protein
VSKTLFTRLGLIGVGLSLAVAATGRPASASLDFFIGARNVVKDEPLSTCNSKARDALNSVLGKAAEYGDTGNWEGYGATDASGNSFAAAAVHCYPLDAIHGYVVTFTCAAQTPPATEAASVICGKLATAFGGQQ